MSASHPNLPFAPVEECVHGADAPDEATSQSVCADQAEIARLQVKHAGKVLDLRDRWSTVSLSVNVRELKGAKKMSASVESIGTRSEAEWQVRVDLAAAHRMTNQRAWDDGIYNHFTHTVPGYTDRFLVKPHGLLMSEVTASNLIVVDCDGNTLAGEGYVETSALHIHAAIHLAVPAATCVLHCHPPHSTWLTCIEDNRLKMCTQTALQFHNRIAYDDHYGGLAMARDEGERMASAIGNHCVMLHANHGVTVIGPTVGHAMHDLYYLEKCCSEYFRLVSSGVPLRVIADDIAANTAEQFDSEHETAVGLTFTAWKRALDREQSDYAT